MRVACAQPSISALGLGSSPAETSQKGFFSDYVVELLRTVAQITSALPEYPEGSVERQNALMTLRNIRFVLARRDFSP